MARMERSTIVGVFEDRSRAEQAIEQLHRAGFTDEQIGFVMPQGERPGTEPPAETGSQAGGGAVGGILAGAGIGGLIAAGAALLIPGFGPVVAGGILATILGGAAVGAAAGGILGALIGAGVPEEEARYYEHEFQQGRILVTVKTNGRAMEAQQILRQAGAYDIEQPRGAVAASRREATHPEGTERVELREEQLRARTRPVEAGEVRVTKDVVEEEQSMEVPVRREEVTIERHPVDRPAPEADLREEEVRVPVSREEVDVQKQTVVREEVEIGKRPVQETEHVTGTVRREEARIEREGNVPVHGMESWDTLAPRYRQTWQSRYGTSGGRYEDYEPYYRYGHEMAYDPRYQGKNWAEVEPELRRNYGTWGQRYGYRADDSAWERFKDTVRESWEAARGQRRAA